MLIALCTIYQQYLKIYGVYSQDDGRRSFSIESLFTLFHLNFYLKRQRSNSLTIWWRFVLHRASNWGRTMGTKMKGFYKGFKYTLSQIFVVKEREMEIGSPTDVKHVTHIGWEGPSGSAPTWMNEFRVGPEFAATSIVNSGSALSPWSSHDFGESMQQQSKSFTDYHRLSFLLSRKRRNGKRQSLRPPRSRVPRAHQGHQERESQNPISSKAVRIFKCRKK